jgi:eukaryotic-like serine/threonine-protein kinase
MSRPERTGDNEGRQADKETGRGGESTGLPVSESSWLPLSLSSCLQPDDLARGLWDDQRRRWEAGDRAPAEAYWKALPAPTDPGILLDLIYGEFVLRQEAGERPTITEYQQRFPQCAAAIARQLSLYQAISESEPETLAPPKPPDATMIDVADPYATTCPPRTVDGNPAQTEPAEIAGFKIIAPLGQGGQGAVYRALHPTLGRDVVIKLGRERIDPKQDADVLIQEGRILAELDDPGLARVYDMRIVDGRVCLIMELIRGCDLEQHARNQQVDARTAALLVAKVARAVASAHRRGVIHRDIKPSNIVIDAAGNPRLIDFGLARLQDAWHRQEEGPGLSGTVCYMAPEQARAEPPGPTSDIFALGGVLYFLLVGRPPYEGKMFAETLKRVQRGEWNRQALAEKKVPAALAAIVAQALAPDPAKRFAAAEHFAAALETFARPRSSAWIVAAGLIVAAVGLLLGGWQFFKPSPTAEPPIVPQAKQAEGARAARPFSLEVRVGRGKRYVDLVECGPVNSGDEIRIQTSAPAKLYASLFVRGASGKLEQLSALAPADEDRPMSYPDNPRKAVKLAGPAGNELILLCARVSGPISLDEANAMLAGCAGWPILLEESVLALSPAWAKVLVKGRDLGSQTDRADPEGEVLRGLEDLRARMAPHFDHFEAIAFSHREKP